MIRHVLIAQPQPLYAYALATLLNELDAELSVVTVATRAEVEAALAADPFTLCVLDIRLGDSEGLPTLSLARALRPMMSVLVTGERESASLNAVVREKGACGYLPKRAPLADVRAALTSALQGGQWFTALPDDTGEQARPEMLSNAQTRVIIELASGRSNKAIAQHLNIAEATVKSHLSAIYRALGVPNRSQAILALRQLEG